MLSCGRVIGRLPKLTRQPPVNHIHWPFKHPGIISIGQVWYSKNTESQNVQKPVGKLSNAETDPSGKSTYSQFERIKPLCESSPNASCPPSCHEVCGIPTESSQNSNKNSGFGITKIRYWQFWGALLITGVVLGISNTVHYFKENGSKAQKDVSKNGTGRRHRRAVVKVKNPPTSSTIPQEVPYLLIGGGTAAFSAFRSIKSRDPKAKVLVITEEEDFPYMRPPLSKELWYNPDRTITAQLLFKQWNGKQRSIYYEPQEFYSSVSNLSESDKGGVAVATGWKVTKLDVVNKTAVLDDGHSIKYDKCLIATGASPKTLPAFASIEDKVKDKIITFRTKDDFLELEDQLHNPSCKNIVIIGGGFLGSELACALASNSGKDKKIHQLYKEKYIMAQVLPSYLSEWTTEKAMLEGVHPIPNAEVKNCDYKNGKLSLILTDGRTIDADQVIVAIGAAPNTELASTSNLEISPEDGGFIVNAELQARTNVWVAGDAACFYDVKLGRRRVEHHDHAVVSGRLAGENMTGAGKPYTHQSMFWSDLGPEVGYEAVGMIDSSLSTVGVFAESPETKSAEKFSSSTDNQETQASEESAQTTAKSNTTDSNAQKSDNKSVDVKSNKEASDIKSEDLRKKQNNFEKGVIFYLRNDTVVGIVLWNIFNRMPIARQVLARGTKRDDLSEIAKLFTIHDD